MSALYSFLHPIKTTVEKEVVISDRFVQMDDEGNPVLDEEGRTIPTPFKIRPMTQEEMDSLVKKSTKTVRVKGQQEEHFDGLEFNRRLIVAATVNPSFSATELCDACGVVSPLLVPVKMLLPGEYKKLLAAITELNGISDPDDKKDDEDSEEKN
mgnify:CR=1 FL=1